MEIKDKISFALESFKNIQELIKFIEQKSGAVLVIIGIEFTAYIEFLKDLKLINSLCDLEVLSFLTFIISLITGILLIYIVYLSIFKVLKPRLAKNYSENEFSIFYFEHIGKLGKIKFEKEYEDLTNNTVLKKINEQQFEVSKILEKKTKYLSLSFDYLFVSILCLSLFILLTLIN